jgi:DNA primase catalytic core
MPIDKEDIKRARRTDLVALFRAKGTSLKKTGKNHIGLCPFHADKTASLSINTSKNLFQCFGCGAAGDPISFVELFDQVGFKEAVKRLNDNGFKRIKPAKSDPPKVLSVKEKKLLARVVGHYQYAFGSEDAKGLDYLQKERGISDTQTLKDFGTGYANGTLLKILPQDPQVVDQLKTIGILNAKGNEVFYNCVVFPLYNARGSIVSLYGRNIDDKAAVKHLYLPGPRSGLVNRQAVKRSQTIILTESIIDALTLYDQGFKNVIPIYGVNGLVDDHLQLLHRKIKAAYLVFDADEPGKRAVDAVSQRLKEKRITPYPVTLPVKDVNIYFKRHTPEQFEALLKTANANCLEQSDKVSKREQSLYKATDHGFVVGFGGRQYEIKGIQKNQTQLKVTVKASVDVTGNRPFELTTIDLYSSRSRIWFGKLCADLFEADQALIKEDIGRLLTLVEDFKPKQKQEAIAEPTRAEKEAAMALLKSPKLFDEILTDLETLGVVGEKTNKIVCYLAAVSRKLEKPLSVLIQSRSSAGKSTLQNAILKLVPDEDYESYTRVTDQALFYKKEDSLVHKILAIEEDAGVGGAAYSIRNIQSAGKITVAVTGKDPGTGSMETEERSVFGPTAVMLTTTESELDQETASRFIVLAIDESSRMTKAIHEKQRKARTLAGLIRNTKAGVVTQKHHIAQRLLRPIAVANNFEPYLSYPCDNLITRRDHDKYLGLIDAIAYLRQYQRKTKTVNVDGKVFEYVQVTLEDIELANRLADEVLGRSLAELAAPSATLLDAIYEMVKALAAKHKTPIEEVEFNRRQIREYINWTDWQIKVHIKQLEQLEYLYVRMGARGKRYSYALNYNGQGRGQREKRFYLNLTPVEEIKKLLKKDKEDRK